MISHYKTRTRCTVARAVTVALKNNMEQIMKQLSMDEKNDECLESASKKENIFLHLPLAMVKDMNLEEKEEYPQKPKESEISTEGSPTEGEYSVDKVWCKSESYSMTWCTYTKQCGIAYAEKRQVQIQSLGQTIISPDSFPRRKTCLNNSNNSKPDRMIISYYKTNIEGLNGQPVVLNFSGSNQFLKCADKNGKAVLTLENVEDDKLKTICKNDKTTWPFVFLLSCTKDNLRHFESAACSGWYIHTGSNSVYAGSGIEKKFESTYQIVHFHEGFNPNK
ncbi:uncharacterized protein LOC131347798 [Hemibagrus wyckioides]|nr:uncharacterized protein LOC131347798 [Hemibagrus wyckioides]